MKASGVLSALLVAGAMARAQTVPPPRTVLNMNDNGSGSLRQVISESIPGDTVRFAPNLAGTISLTNGEILIGKSLRIEGPGPSLLAVSGGHLSRLFRVTGSRVAISGLALSDGRALGQDGADGFGVGWNGEPGESALGGALLNAGELTLSNCVLFSNVARGGRGGNGSGDARFLPAGSGALGGTARGGAIANLGVLALVNCALIGNQCEGGAGGDGGTGYNGIRGLGGSGADGGGGLGAAVDNKGALMASGCAFNYNAASGGKGGDGAAGAGFGGGGGQGGTSQGGAVNSGGTCRLINCNLSYNGVLGAFGGPAGDGNSGSFPGGRGGSGYGGAIAGVCALIHCTIVKNMAGAGDGGVAPDPGFNGGLGINAGGGLRSLLPGGVMLNSVIALNTLAESPVLGPDVEGAVTSLGHNFIGVNSGSSGWQSTDLLGTVAAPRDPLLGPLSYQGGPTSIMAPRPGSPLLEAGDDAVLAPPFNLATDQRGGLRRLYSHVDIGAIEVGSGAKIIAVRPKGSATEIVFNTEAGFTHLLESRDTLESDEWTAFGLAVAGTGGQATALDPRPRAAVHRFYRVILSPL